MRTYFEGYGEVSDCVLMMDRTTGSIYADYFPIGKSRGFGFVTMKNPDDVKAILNESQHVLDGKTVTFIINQSGGRLIARKLYPRQPTQATNLNLWSI